MSSLAAPYLAFAGFGVFWGTWGAALPALRDTAGLSDAELGSALLCVGLGALPGMLLTGKAVDRFGARIAGVFFVALALSGVLLTLLARDGTSIAVSMLIIGAASGASDVAANALAGLEEARSGRRVITLAHAVFSSFVVIGSLGAGALYAASEDVKNVFVVAGLFVAVTGIAVLALGPAPTVSAPGPAPAARPKPRLPLLFIAVGLIGALAFAAENAHQSWGAIFLTDQLRASPALAAAAPATFAAFAAITRFTAGSSNRISANGLLTGGAIIAALGTLLLAGAQNIPTALLGLALAAIGTSVLFPTLLSQATREVSDSRRGRMTSAIATTAYLGYVLGPVYVGVLASAVGLRGSMTGVAALMVAFVFLLPVAARLTRQRRYPPTS